MSQYSGKHDFYDVLNFYDGKVKVVDFEVNHVKPADYPKYYAHSVQCVQYSTVYLNPLPIYYSESLPTVTDMLKLVRSKKFKDLNTTHSVGNMSRALWDKFPTTSPVYVAKFIYSYLEDPTRSALEILYEIGPIPLYQSFYENHKAVLND